MSSVGPTAAVMRDWTLLCLTASVLAMVIHREPIPIGRMPESGALVLLRGMPRKVEKDEDKVPGGPVTGRSPSLAFAISRRNSWTPRATWSGSRVEGERLIRLRGAENILQHLVGPAILARTRYRALRKDEGSELEDTWCGVIVARGPGDMGGARQSQVACSIVRCFARLSLLSKPN